MSAPGACTRSSALVPTAAIRSPAIAIASASRFETSPVQIRPLTSASVITGPPARDGALPPPHAVMNAEKRRHALTDRCMRPRSGQFTRAALGAIIRNQNHEQAAAIWRGGEPGWIHRRAERRVRLDRDGSLHRLRRHVQGVRYGGDGAQDL